MIYIYALSTEEQPNNFRYVGKTNDIKKRLSKHISKYYLNEVTYKTNWINSELNKGNSIKITIIDEVPDNEWEFWESYWIEQLKWWGFKLTNSTKGGDGVSLTQTVLDKRNETNRVRLNEKLKEEILKYSINKINGVWEGKRECPICELDIQYSSKKRSTVLAMTKRANEENRVCNSCKATGEKNHFYGKELNDGDIKRKRYGKNILQFTLDDKLVCEFSSIRKASEITGIDRKSISNCCNKIKSYNTAGNFKFKFKKDE